MKLQSGFILSGILLTLLFGCSRNPINPVGNPPADGGDISALVTTLTFCPEGISIAPSDLPTAIMDYLSANYATDQIENAETFDDNGNILYGVSLASGTEILFNADGSIHSTGVSLDEFTVSVDSLPSDIGAYLQSNFPSVIIASAQVLTQFGDSYYEIDLNDSTSVYFNDAGMYLCESFEAVDSTGTDNDTDVDNNDNDNDTDVDNNDNDNDNGNDTGNDNDDTDHDNTNLPQSIMDYIDVNYTTYTITDSEQETACNGSNLWEVEIKDTNGQKSFLVFDNVGGFLYTSSSITSAELPDVITASIASNYSGFQVDDASKWHSYPDGTSQYEVELKNGATDTDMLVLFDSDGSILCELTDND